MPSLGIANSRENTEPTQKMFYFCPFLAYFEPFCPVVRSSGSPAALICPGPAGVLPIVQSCPDAPSPALSSRMQGPKPTRAEERKGSTNKERNKGTRDKGTGARERAGAACIAGATRERGGTKERQRQAHKPTKRGTPPIASWQDAATLHNFSRQKISKKSLGVVLKKFSENFSWECFGGKKNPSRYLNERGLVKQMKNCGVSNLAMQVNQKRTKAILNNRGQR